MEPNEYDRFSHIIICNIRVEAICAVPYVYTRNNFFLNKKFIVVSCELHPSFRQFAVNGELLQVISYNPTLLLSFVERRKSVIPNLHQELMELKSLKLLDEGSALMLSSYLKAFCKTINTLIIPFSPEHDGDLPDVNPPYIENVICSHIENRELPMVKILSFPQEIMTMVNDLIIELSKFSAPTDFLIYSPFAPLFKEIRSSKKVLDTLMADEFRCVKFGDHVDSSSPFVFNQKQIEISEVTIQQKRALKNLTHYVGEFLEELDLSKSFITGPAIAASLIISNLHINVGLSHNEIIDIFYPKLLTIIEPEAHSFLRTKNITKWNIELVSENQGVITKHDRSFYFSVKPGSSVDIAVDDTVSDEEFCSIAFSHYETIKKFYPYVKIRKQEYFFGGPVFYIYTDEIPYIPTFRSVEIYKSSFTNICKNHVGAERGCYTSFWSDTRQFYLTATAVWTSRNSSTPNFYQSNRIKSSPQDVLINNLLRGFNISDSFLRRIIDNYTTKNDIFISHLPFYLCRNVPFSIFSSHLEWPHFSPSRKILPKVKKIQPKFTKIITKTSQIYNDIQNPEPSLLTNDLEQSNVNLLQFLSEFD